MNQQHARINSGSFRERVDPERRIGSREFKPQMNTDETQIFSRQKAQKAQNKSGKSFLRFLRLLAAGTAAIFFAGLGCSPH